MRRILLGYQYCLKYYTLATQAVQTGLLMGCGDVVAQIAIEKKNLKEMSPRRTTEFLLLGTCFIGPTLATWYKILDKLIPGPTGGTRVIKKVLVDQLIFAPCIIVVLLVIINLMQGHEIEKIKERVKHDYFDVLIANYTLWPWAQLFNFYLIPLKYQILYAQLIALFWNTYISWKANVEQRKTLITVPSDKTK